MSAVSLFPIGPPEPPTLTPKLVERLSRTFDVRVRLRVAGLDPRAAYDPVRGQYSSTELLRLLLQAMPGDDERLLGVAGVDLFIPVLSFVFGEAQLGGRAAVVSTHRLDPRRYGLPADPRLLLSRLEKEAVHELGHTFGLIHCDALECVMHSSTYVEEIDLKTAGFCAGCRTAVHSPAA